MDAEFWLQRWQDRQIGFHQDRVTPLLEQYWDAIGLQPGSCVFVPLAGKTLDMRWLAERGHRVLGVELSRLAVEQFFDELRLVPAIHESRYGIHHAAAGIELICGDALGLDADALSGCMGVFDRAALIALPPAMRERYVTGLCSQLPIGCRGLLVTLEYPQHEKAGPPFAVPEGEVRRVYSRDWKVELLERRDILATQATFVAQGVSALDTVAYRLLRR